MSTDRVLVVDDELFVRELLQEYFAKLRFTVDVAESGEAALTLMEKDRYSVALVDMKMAGMDGLLTLRKMRELDHDVVVILMTGYPTVESSIDALRIGAYDYIVKPFRLNELKDVVTGALKEYEVRSEITNLKAKIKMLEDLVKAQSANPPAAKSEPLESSTQIRGEKKPARNSENAAGRVKAGKNTVS